MATPRTQRTALAAAAAIKSHLLLSIIVSADLIVLLVYTGIALPAVWSAKPARRKAASDTLRQILTFLDNISRRARSQ
jgi:hypothetical protein